MSSVKLREEKDCLNCGEVVEKHFCPNCGQENIIVKEDALHMVAHAIADYFHFEHKFFGTLKPLLLKPGKLTEAYVAGKRASFINPIRLYIFISIVFFLVVFGGKKTENKKTETTKTTTNLTQKEKDSLTAKNVKGLEKALKYVPIEAKLKDSIVNAAKEEDKVEVNQGKKKKNWNIDWGTKDSTVVAYEKRQLALPKEKRDGFIKHYFNKRSIEVSDPNSEEKFFEDMLHNIPKMMFILLPMFALILKLVYLRKKKYYYEHLIYSFHVHSAIFLSILVTMLLQWMLGFTGYTDDWLSLLCMIYIIWYIYRSLRTFYGSSRWLTILKMSFLGLCYNIVLIICFLVIMAVSFVMV